MFGPDPTGIAVQRFKMDCSELLDSYRSHLWRLRRIERELGLAHSVAELDQLQAEKERLTRALSDIQARLRADWDRSPLRQETREALTWPLRSSEEESSVTSPSS